MLISLGVMYTLFIDINECSNYNGGCEQYCTNTDGSFTCYCDPGFNQDGFFNCTGKEYICEHIEKCILYVLFDLLLYMIINLFVYDICRYQ